MAEQPNMHPRAEATASPVHAFFAALRNTGTFLLLAEDILETSLPEPESSPTPKAVAEASTMAQLAIGHALLAISTALGAAVFAPDTTQPQEMEETDARN